MAPRLPSFSAFLALAIASVCGSACAPVDEDVTPAVQDLSASGVSAAVERALAAQDPAGKDHTWTSTRGNAITSGGILQVPVASTWGQASLLAPRACASSGGCEEDFQLATCSADADCGAGRCAELAATRKRDGDAPAKVCVGHSDALLDEIYGVMISAHERLDVTSLGPPSGRFLATMRNALTTLDARGEPVVVRFLFGEYQTDIVDLDGTLDALTRDVKRDSRLTISIAAHSTDLATWNHSKIISADGADAIVGGMNLWGDHYLDEDPVHDVSLHVKGPVANAMQSFANELWAKACLHPKKFLTHRHGETCPATYAPRAIAPAGDVPMLGVGRLGRGPDSAKIALVAMMETAKRSIHVSQQDIGSFRTMFGGNLVNEYVDAWIRAAQRGVDVEIVLSNDNARGGHGSSAAGSYSNGWSREKLWSLIASRARRAGPGASAAICARLHLSTLRSTTATTWADGKPLANHAKVVIVDDAAYYVGSQNLYDANLAEYGVIVDDRASTERFAREYFDMVAAESSRAPYRDASCR